MKNFEFSKLIYYVIFFLLGLIVFFPAITFAPDLSTSQHIIIRSSVFLILLLSASILKKNQKFDFLQLIPLIFAAAAAAMFISWAFSGYFLKLIGFTTDTPMGIAVTKFTESFFIVTMLLVGVKLLKIPFDDVYLKKGKIKSSLLIGIISFITLWGLSLWQAYSGGISIDFLKGTPAILIFCLSNGFMEELLFRGIFLKKFSDLIGAKSAVIVTSLTFALVHSQVSYTPDVLVFLIITFILALAWGYIILKTKSLLASILFHAGADTLIFFGIVAQYSG